VGNRVDERASLSQRRRGGSWGRQQASQLLAAESGGKRIWARRESRPENRRQIEGTLRMYSKYNLLWRKESFAGGSWGKGREETSGDREARRVVTWGRISPSEDRREKSRTGIESVTCAS